MRLLLGARADVNKTSSGSVPDIIVAAGLGDVETTRTLLEARANIDEDNEGFLAPLGFAAWRGEDDVTRLLVEGRADVQKRSGGIPVIELAAEGTALLLSQAGLTRQENSTQDARERCTQIYLESYDCAIRLRQCCRYG